MILGTERLLLTDYKLENLDAFFKLKSCNEVWKYSTFASLKDKEQARILLKNLIDEGIDANYIYNVLYKKG